MNPVISVILPSYNVAPYIGECLESALGQTQPEMELLCVDACSEDGTQEILLEYERRAKMGEWPGKSIKLMRSERRSYGYQVNLALREAAGRYVAILETDDFIVPEMYERLIRLSDEMELDYIRGEYDFFTTQEDGSRVFRHVHHYAPVNELLTNTRSERIMTYDQNLWKGIYRREFLLENRIFLNESEGAAFQDIGFNMQVFSFAKRAYYVEESYYRYRRDRQDSSIHSLACFRFYLQELTFLHNLDPEYEKLYWPGIYERFACALCGEYHKALHQFQISPDSEYLAPYVPVLLADFRSAMDQGIWPAPTTPKGQVKAVEKLFCEGMGTDGRTAEPAKNQNR
uniref:glycosyltransferase family 2 protein n=1 Tax=Eubacterium cellulosolvens TaxID=29322 RepID=UPI0004876039|nr:glycosyltransferase [[Eubacterium] cellulosolvens]